VSDYPDRIPYDSWINSQLSIARHYGGINLGGDFYAIEKPSNDLVKPKPKKSIRKKTKQ
jgi:hypothetical protein